MDDHKILELLKTGRRDKAFIRLYKGYPSIEKLILSKGGSEQDAQDIFQEALIVFYKKALTSDFVLTASISTYLYSVARFLWKDELIKKNKNQKVELANDINSKESEELSSLIEKEFKFKAVEEVLEKIGEKCLKLLQLFYYKKLSMKEVAKQVDLRSDKVAKSQKYKCLERARELLKEVQAGTSNSYSKT